LRISAQRQREAARKTAQRAISSKRFARVLRQARLLVAAKTTESLAQFGAAAMTRTHRKLLKRARGIEWSDAAARHAVRIRVKRLRYTCELFAPTRASPYVAALKELQEILGELNDIAVGRRLIGFEADESALLRRLGAAWKRFARRPVFWRAAG